MSAPSLVLNVFSTFTVGGPQMRFARLANHFGDRYRHAVIAMDGRTDCRELIGPGVAITFPEAAIRKGRLLSNVLSFRSVLMRLRPDLLITSNWGAIEWAIANGIPLVPHVHLEDGFGPEEQAAQLPRRIRVRRLALRRSLTVLPSRTLLRIASDVWKLDTERLRYVPNGIDLSRFRPRPAARACALRSQWRGVGPVIGAVAVLRREKNLGRLLEAVALLAPHRQFRLVIAGDGRERAPLEQQTTSLGLDDRVTFLGQVAEPELLYAAFDLFALSSDTEQMPLSVLEAMACGVPIAATDVGDVPIMLSEENRPYVVGRSAAELASAIASILDGSDGAARAGHANRLKAEREFGEAGMMRAWQALFDGHDPARV